MGNSKVFYEIIQPQYLLLPVLTSTKEDSSFVVLIYKPSVYLSKVS